MTHSHTVTHMPFLSSVIMDKIDGIGHWASNTCQEVYAAKISKLVSLVLALIDDIVGSSQCSHLSGCCCSCRLLCWQGLPCSMGWNSCAEQASNKALPLCRECAYEPQSWAMG